MTPSRPVRLGVLGCGHVGAALVRLLHERRADIAARTGLDLLVTRVAVR
jgi:homoserine dehydrogenase